MLQPSSSRPSPWIRLTGIAATLLAALLLASLSPVEQVLGASAHLVYLHGAWIWAVLVVFALAAAAGAAALITQKRTWHQWSRALGQSAMIFWLVSLPMSLLVMQINWGGFYFDEPRWRIPFAFAIAGLLVQVALVLINILWLSSAANLVFGAALLYAMTRVTSVLHPDSPIFTSDSADIRIFFAILLALILLASLQVAAWLRRPEQPLA